MGFILNFQDRKGTLKLNGHNQEIIGDYDRMIAVGTENGIFVPENDKKVLAFLGIPYAKAPVGKLRFRAPEAPDRSDRVFEAKHFGPSCLQYNAGSNLLRDHQQSEDCLYLNVWTAPAKEEETVKKPVIVYIHGGDFTFGGSANPVCSGENFVKDHPETVFVSFNYRLGLLGFLPMNGLTGKEKYPDSANLGILDQIAALSWVKKNIASFGGDPGNVTLMGDSAGGTCITALAVCDRAKGLFNKAILLEPSLRILEQGGKRTLETAEQFFRDFHITCTDDLPKLPEKELAEYIHTSEWIACLPQCDGNLIPTDIEQAFADGNTGDIQLIIGNARDETGVYRSAISTDEYRRWLSFSLKQILETEKDTKVRKLYDDAVKAYCEEKAAEMAVEYWYNTDASISLLEKLTKRGNKAYAFFFDLDTEIEKLGSGSMIIPTTVLGNDDAAEIFGSIVHKQVK